MNQHVPLPPPTASHPAFVTVAGDKARVRFLEFFGLQIRNPHTRRAYARAAGEFLSWCETHGVASIAAVQPMHVGGYVEDGPIDIRDGQHDDLELHTPCCWRPRNYWAYAAERRVRNAGSKPIIAPELCETNSSA